VFSNAGLTNLLLLLFDERYGIDDTSLHLPVPKNMTALFLFEFQAAGFGDLASN